MVKNLDLLLTVPVGMQLLGLSQHETLIIALSLPIFSRSNCRVTWMIKGIEWAAGTVI